MGHKINSGDFHGKSMGHENRLWRNSWVMKKIPLIHGKFRAKNNPMKFHFAAMGHEMIFMGFSCEIHGIFIKLQFIVHTVHVWFLPAPDNRGWMPAHMQTLKQLSISHSGAA